MRTWSSAKPFSRWRVLNMACRALVFALCLNLMRSGAFKGYSFHHVARCLGYGGKMASEVTQPITISCRRIN